MKPAVLSSLALTVQDLCPHFVRHFIDTEGNGMTFIFESHEGERREYFPAEWIEGGRYREIIDHLQWVERDIEGPKPNERPTLKSRWLRAKGRLNRPLGRPVVQRHHYGPGAQVVVFQGRRGL